MKKEEKQKIRDAIFKQMAPDDKEPWRIVEEDYGGDWERYLRVMAGWHGIKMEGKRKTQKQK